MRDVRQGLELACVFGCRPLVDVAALTRGADGRHVGVTDARGLLCGAATAHEGAVGGDTAAAGNARASGRRLVAQAGGTSVARG